MTEDRFTIIEHDTLLDQRYHIQDTNTNELRFGTYWDQESCSKDCEWLNDQMELIEELHASDEMGWKMAERCKKDCPRELQNKKRYIDRLEYKVQVFKEWNQYLEKENQKLQEQLDKIPPKIKEVWL